MATPPRPASSKGTPRTRRVAAPGSVGVRERARRALEHPSVIPGLGVTLALALIAAALVALSLERPVIAVGQVMTEARTVRVPFTSVDPGETARQRTEAAQRTPLIFSADVAALEEIRTSLDALPRAVAGAKTPEEVEPGIRDAFAINAERLGVLQQIASDEGELTRRWSAAVTRLDDILRRRPLMDLATFQTAAQQGLSPQIELRGASATPTLVSRFEAINLGDQVKLNEELRTIVDRAGFAGALADVVVRRLTQAPRATYSHDVAGTQAAQNSASAGVQPVIVSIPVGQKIYDRGDVLTQAQLGLAQREVQEFLATAGTKRVWTRRAASGLMGACVVFGLAAYIAAFCPAIARRAPRMIWLAGLIAAAVGLAVGGSIAEPGYQVLLSLTPPVLVGVLVAVAYDRRTALGVAAAAGVIIGLALDQPASWLVAGGAGILAALSQLRDMRDRWSLIRIALVTGAALAVGTAAAGLMHRPLPDHATPAALAQTLRESLMGGLSGLLVGGLTLFLLPVVERFFGITTGMTLVELRDPKQPLLRELQQRAPGTYNHSLNVASIAEAAADAIGADSLLTYVGCLYHDIGKMSKPEYFVENQAGGPNKHDKLSPAMSLLVIVGHVKDGVEMAREAGLPRPLLHFIEAHHGTTLVEYFFHRARKLAEADGTAHDDTDRLPEEVDYRYPGPKPRTKEVAIVMLADAVESATRSLTEPTPSRIDALVRDLANKRLMDGQFDECDLTLRELRTICDSVSKTVASIYHGRVKYASTSGKFDKPRATVSLAPAGPKPPPNTMTQPGTDLPPGPGGPSGPDLGLGPTEKSA
jgi:hypothetical protein